MGTGIVGPDSFCPGGLAVPAIPARKGGGARVMKYALRKTGASALIFPGAVVVGDVGLGKGVSIWYNAVVRGDEGAVSIGDNTNVQDGVIVHADTKVGCGCTIGHRAVVHGCTIGDNTLVGMGAILLDGARIGGGLRYRCRRAGDQQDGDSRRHPGAGQPCQGGARLDEGGNCAEPGIYAGLFEHEPGSARYAGGAGRARPGKRKVIRLTFWQLGLGRCPG